MKIGRQATIWFFAAALGMAFAPWDAPGAEAPSPLNDWKNGYENFDRGEQARDRGHYVDALAAFRAARECYLAVRKARPDWNIKLINSRIESCESEIRRVEALLPAGSPALKSASGAAGVAAETTPRRRSGTDGGGAELEEYKERLFKALYELDESKKRIAAGEKAAKEAENLMKEYRLLQSKYGELNMRYTDLSRRSSSGGAAISEKELLDLKINYEMLQRRAAELEKGRVADASAIKSLSEKLDMAELRLKKAAGSDAERNRELETLRKFRQSVSDAENANLKQIEKLKETVADLEKELSAERANFKAISDKLKTPSAAPLAENEKLRRDNLEQAKKITALSRDAEELKKQFREANLENNRLRITVQKLDNTRKQLEESMLLQQEAAAGKLREAERVKLELERLKQTSETLSGEVKSWMIKAAGLEKRLESLGEGEKRLSDKLTRNNRALTAENIQLKMDLAKSGDDLAKLQSALDAQSAEYRKQKLQLLSLADADVKLKKLQADFAAAQKVIAEKAALEKRLADAGKKLAAQEKELKAGAALRGSLRESEKANQKLADEKARLARRWEDAEKAKKALEAERTVLRQALDDAKKAAASGGKTAVAAGSVPPAPQVPVADRKKLLAGAEAALKKGDVELAVWNCREILKSDPDDFEANFRLGTILLKREEYAEAERLFQTARLQAPQNLECVLSSAGALIGLGKGGNALSVLESAGNKLDNDARYHLLRAKAMLLSGDAKGAGPELKRALELKGDDGETLLLLAECSSDDRTGAEYYRRAKDISGGFSRPELEKRFGKYIDEKRSTIAFLASAAAEAERSGSADNAAWYYRQLAATDAAKEIWKKRLAAALVAGNMNESALAELKETTPDAVGMLISALAWAKMGDYGKCAGFTYEAAKRKISARDLETWDILRGVLADTLPRVRLSLPETAAAELENLLKKP